MNTSPFVAFNTLGLAVASVQTTATRNIYTFPAGHLSEDQTDFRIRLYIHVKDALPRYTGTAKCTPGETCVTKT